MSDVPCSSSAVAEPKIDQVKVEEEKKEEEKAVAVVEKNEEKKEEKTVAVVEKKEEKKEIAQPLSVPEKLTQTMMRLKLEAQDGNIIEVDKDVAFKSRLIKNMMENLGLSESDEAPVDPLPVTNVNGKTLEKILVYCKEKKDEEYKPKDEKDDPRINLTQWDNEYMDVSAEELLAILMGANYLDIPGIIDITTQKIANMADGKSVEELREMFELENDFTPEEEEEIRQRFAWVEQ